DQQLHPDRIDDHLTDAALADLPSIHLSTPDLLAKYPQPKKALALAGSQRRDRLDMAQHVPQMILVELQAQKIVRAVHSQRKLQEVMTDFWFNHFNVFWGKNADRWLTTGFEMNAIRPHVLGKFKDLLMAT